MKKIDPITAKIGNDLSNIRIIKNFMNEEDRLLLLDYCKRTATKQKGHIFYPVPLDPTIKHLHIKYTRMMYENVSNYYDQISLVRKPHLPESDYDTSVDVTHEEGTWMASILAHPDGSFMYPHVDIVGYVQEENTTVPDYLNKWSGHLSAVIYLNDDYEGGELYFPDHDLSIKPEPGDFITWPGSGWYVHGVKEVKNGVRFTLSTWLRFEAAYGKEEYSYGQEK